MGPHPGVDGCAVALYRRLSPLYGCVMCGENVSCRTVNCWVRLPCGLRHAIPLQNDLQKGNTPDSSFCALVDLVRLAGPLPSTNSGPGASSAAGRCLTAGNSRRVCTGRGVASVGLRKPLPSCKGFLILARGRAPCARHAIGARSGVAVVILRILRDPQYATSSIMLLPKISPSVKAPCFPAD